MHFLAVYSGVGVTEEGTASRYEMITMQKDRETRLCRQCYGHIDVRAKVCPHCRRPTGTGLVQEFKWKLVELAFAAVAVVGMYFAIQLAVRYLGYQMTQQFARPKPPAVQKHTQR